PKLPTRHSFGETLDGFVDLDDLAFAAYWPHPNRSHCLTDAVRQEPSGFESAPQSPVQLVGANALLRRSHEENCLEPVSHRDVAGLEEGADFHSEGLAAGVALVGADPGGASLHFGDALDALAVRADWPGRPNPRLYPSVSRRLVVKMSVRNNGRHKRDSL